MLFVTHCLCYLLCVGFCVPPTPLPPILISFFMNLNRHMFGLKIVNMDMFGLKIVNMETQLILP